jgi:hypothetical protein
MPDKNEAPKGGDSKPAAPEPPPTEAGETDVEGHFMLPNYAVARENARQREREIQKQAERHGLEADARTTPKPKTK